MSRRFLEDGTRVRVAKRSGALIPKPEFKRDSIRRAGELFFCVLGLWGLGLSVCGCVCGWWIVCLVRVGRCLPRTLDYTLPSVPPPPFHN